MSDSLESTSRVCVSCKVSKPLSTDYERTNTKSKSPGYRAECKHCRKTKRSNAVAAAQATIAVPTEPPACHTCVECNRDATVVQFKWRTDVCSGGWRNVCNPCYNDKGYCQAYRDRERAKDEAGYLKRNAEAHSAWVKRNPRGSAQ